MELTEKISLPWGSWKKLVANSEPLGCPPCEQWTFTEFIKTLGTSPLGTRGVPQLRRDAKKFQEASVQFLTPLCAQLNSAYYFLPTSSILTCVGAGVWGGGRGCRGAGGGFCVICTQRNLHAFMVTTTEFSFHKFIQSFWSKQTKK